MALTRKGNVRRTQVSVLDFLAVYTPMARDGKSLKEIAERCNEKFKQNYDSQLVSQRASLARKYLKDNEEVLKKQGVTDIEKYIADHVPTVGGQGGGGGRKSQINSVLEFLNKFPAPTPTTETESETEPQAETKAE
jgi:hypothetical protein